MMAIHYLDGGLEIGGVLMTYVGPRLILSFDDQGNARTLDEKGDAGWLSYDTRDEFSRPATPEEAEPFRPMLDGLKRSLGEA